MTAIGGNGGGLCRERPERRAVGARRSSPSRSPRASSELEALGVVVKDLDLGLLDFPGVRDGEEVELCWQVGEDAVAYWHRLEAGFARAETDRLGRIGRPVSDFWQRAPDRRRGDRRHDRGREARRLAHLQAVARPERRDALPRAAADALRGDRLRRRPVGAARHPAGSRGRRRRARLVGGDRPRDRLRQPAHDRQRRRRRS